MITDTEAALRDILRTALGDNATLAKENYGLRKRVERLELELDALLAERELEDATDELKQLRSRDEEAR